MYDLYCHFDRLTHIQQNHIHIDIQVNLFENAISKIAPYCRRNADIYWGRDKMAAIFQCIFLNENIILIEISLNFVPKGPINNIPALVQIMVWRRPGDKPLSESLMVSLLAHICITRPQWVNMNISTFIVILDKAFTEWKQLNYNKYLSQIHMWDIATSLQILIKHIPRILT